MKPPRDSAATVQAQRLIDSRGWTAYKAASPYRPMISLYVAVQYVTSVI